MFSVDNVELKASKNHRGNASQFFVAGELCRRGHSAVVTLGNTPNVDVLCSNLSGTKFVHIQVKTFPLGATRCIVGQKAEINNGESFFWILTGLPSRESDKHVNYFIIPSKNMSYNIKEQYDNYLKTPGAKGQLRIETAMRTVAIPPKTNRLGWSIKEFQNRWDLIDEALK
jgi:hypothetical protein